MTHPQSPSENDTGSRSESLEAEIPTALGRIPSGLFIVTWREAARDRGMLASWVMQAGFSPPMISLAVAPGRDLLAAVDSGTRLVVNVLGETQRPLLARFGKPATTGDDPFAGLSVSRSTCGTATLDEAAAWLECVPVAQTSGTDVDRCDHVVVLARVTAAGAGKDRAPLVHLRKNGLRY
ncbi:MAG: flavin reductase family protein [Planctomycetia bacterium]